MITNYNNKMFSDVYLKKRNQVRDKLLKMKPDKESFEKLKSIEKYISTNPS